MRKAGVIWIGHSDYLNENAYRIQEDIYKHVKEIPLLDVRLDGIVASEDQAIAAVRGITRDRDCCAAVVVFATWVECNVVMAAMKELRGLPCLFWGFPPEEVEGKIEGTGAYVSATMFAGVVKRLNLTYPTIYTSWKQEETLRQIKCFARTASAIDQLFYTKIGLFGYTSMSIYTGTFDHVLLRYQIGPEVEQMDTYSLIRAAEGVSEEELKIAEDM